MKKLFNIWITIFGMQAVNAQIMNGNDSIISFQDVIYSDTTVEANYYELELRVFEKKEYKKINRKWVNVTTVDLDSAKRQLIQILAKFGLFPQININGIFYESGYSGNYRISKTATFSCKMYGKDTVEMLAKKLDPEVVIGMRVRPIVTIERQNQIKKYLTEKAQMNSKKSLDSFAAKYGFENGKISYQFVNFIPVAANITYNSEPNNKGYVVNLGNPSFSYYLTVGYVFQRPN